MGLVIITDIKYVSFVVILKSQPATQMQYLSETSVPLRLELHISCITYLVTKSLSLLKLTWQRLSPLNEFKEETAEEHIDMHETVIDEGDMGGSNTRSRSFKHKIVVHSLISNAFSPEGLIYF